MNRQFSRRQNSAICGTLLTLTAWLALAAPAAATTISFTYDEDARPSFDPNGVKLMAIVTAAGQIWSDYINAYQIAPNGQSHPAVYHFDLSYENTGGSELGHYDTSWDNMVIDTSSDNGAAIDWFFDPTPFENSEFLMKSLLVGELDATNPQAVDNAYDGLTMPLMEAAYSGPAIAPAAMGKYDMLTTVLHEMGHMLGYNWNPNDDDYDFAGSTIGGHALALNENVDMHGGVEQSLMYPSVALGMRKLPSTSDILGLADEGNSMSFDVPRMEYLGDHSTNWNDTLNWIGGAIPDADNQVFVRNGGIAIMAASGSAASVTISDSSQVFVNNNQYNVVGGTLLGNQYGKTGALNIGSLISGISRFETTRLDLVNGRVNLQNAYATLVVKGDASIGVQGTLLGAGRVEIGGTLTNNGAIEGGAFQLIGFGGQLTLATTGGGKLDLDGNSIAEAGRVRAVGGNLIVAGPLSDDFDGTATIGPGRKMAFFQPWRNHGKLEFRGGSTPDQAAWLGSGGLMTFDGQMDVDGLGMIGAPMTLYGSTKITVRDANDQITFAGPTTLSGVLFEGQGSLAIAGVTSVDLPDPIWQHPATTGVVVGPTASTALVLPGQVASTEGVYTRIPTTYTFSVPVTLKPRGELLAYGSSLVLPRLTTMSSGRIGGLHTVNQIGDLVVDGASIINPTTFIWGGDATNHKTELRAYSQLDLTPRQIVRGGSDNVYNGAIKLATNARLHVDLGAATSWRLAGSMQLNTGASVTGDDMISNGVVSGSGTILVSRFENSGRVIPGRLSGGLLMPNATFVQTTTGILDVVLGQPGLAPAGKGAGTGLLTVGTAQLSGTLTLSLGTGISPAVGSEFDFLRAASVSGTFNNVLLTGTLGQQFQGTLLYGSDRVTFRITSVSGRLAVGVVPEPSTAWMAMLMVGPLAVCRRRS
ncbi:PEP-CTERM sorting domain-containing protein [Lacipirellula limnantheis]|uniref:Autotransporter-associated beta strand repeat protein n=1 Tax=Lacipirellula limnantheis TaxID=2528024 RepID=A0A517U250_9BACT|nr:PEP-CTERM sorting domain-containing protein [Lacipirellula limnantheis]QDT74706.1 hypothetical protein I41_39050 [Lacipirellula limnantheis]